ncbi:Uma2 family endonuclease [Chryseolinea lacunae]|uniref:Uma2 family endonuclease n=1 Tax=Chryseolinea lacunae TaxID=2801331 RepID=A0ABS1KVZ0_9BACT|nr:Uma2 family endonuclease [Chryseolinea lacunae]MBL0743417.1 Uma2 family endonuclease [Chryseolinea lacunae]
MRSTPPKSYPEGLTDDEFFVVCESHPGWRFERDVTGKVTVMSPVGANSSNKNFTLTVLFGNWLHEHPELGYAFDSSAGFTLPDGSIRSPDLSWIKKERWEVLTPEERNKFAPVCPDFVVELRSASDVLKTLQTKMTEWINNGCQLGWLIDPLEQKVFIYQPGKPPEEFSGFHHKLSGGALLPEFELDLLKLK